MLGDSHQLDMGVAHLVNVGRKFLCHFAVSVKALFFFAVFTLPGTDMYLIDTDRLFTRIGFFSVFHPGIVIPLE